MRRMTPEIETGPLALVMAVWRQAWREMCAGNGRSEAARKFLLDEGAMEFLESLGVEPGAVERIVQGKVDIEERRRRDVVRMYLSGLAVSDIVLKVYRSYGRKNYDKVRAIIREEVGDVG